MTPTVDTAERPRERLVRHGANALSSSELLALLIGHGTAGASAESIARSVLEQFPSLADLAARDVAELRRIHGMGTAKAARLCAALELGARLQAESFHVLLLNTANQLLRDVMVSQGSLNACVIHPREVFRIAIAENAAAVILLHNHPSGNTEPSPEDIAITRQLVDAGRIVDIRVLDHVIIGGDDFTSFAERHLL
jgi:DNA repair protein RadC